MSTLAGRRILLTRATEDNAAWALRLHALGATPVGLPCITCATLPDAREALLPALRAADWLTLASPRAAQAVCELVAGALHENLRIGVVGPATAAAAEELLGRVDLTARGGTAAALADDLLALPTPPRHVLAAGARGGRNDLAERLRAAGVEVTTVDVHTTQPATGGGTRFDAAALRLHAVFLASPSALTGLLNLTSVPRGVPLITIGPTTSAAVREAGLVVAAESASRDIDGLIAALERFLACSTVSPTPTTTP